MAGYFTEDFIDDVRNSNDIVEIVSEYVKLKKSGKNYFGLCPFHTEKTPSFSVAPDKQIFHCFGCGEGGNVITFISKVENLDFVETVKFLADRAKITIPDFGDNVANKKKQSLKESLYAINTESAKYFRDMLNSNRGKEGKSYLQKRGITASIIQKFGLGFADGLTNDLYKHLLKLGFESTAIVASGIAVKSENGNINDRFKMRIMFPIFDVRGKVIAFGGRVMDDKLPKYLNSPETLIFSKGRNLYAMNFAKNSKEKMAVIVEGYMDAISLYEKGMDNVVASLGTALTDNQARLIGKYFEEVGISYDSDAAGQMAALRGLDIVSNIGIPVKVVEVKDAKDPDEFVRKKGVQAFKNLINESKELPEYKINLLRKEFDLNDNRQKINFLNKAAVILAELQNNIERDVYVQKVSKETGIGVEPIYAEINKIQYKMENNLKPVDKAKVANAPKTVENKPIDKKTWTTERLLIAVLSNNDNNALQNIRNEIAVEDLSNPNTKNILKVIYSVYDKNKNVVPADVINLLDNEQDISIYTDILQKEAVESDNIKLSRQLINTIKKEKLELIKKEILEKLKQNDIHKDSREELDMELVKITVQLKQLGN